MSEDGPDRARRLDCVFDALGDPCRRRALTRLHDWGGDDEPFEPSELVGQADVPARPAADLYHRHLPKLADFGFVEWDREADLVRPGPRFDEVAPVIDLLRSHEDELPTGWP